MESYGSGFDPMKYQLATHALLFPRYSTDKILKIKVTRARSKVQSRSHQDVADLHTN